MKRHRFDPFSFLFGSLFLVIGGTFLFGGSGLDVARPERMWAAATIVVGVSLAVWAVARITRTEPVAPAPADGGVAWTATSPEDIDEGPSTVTFVADEEQHSP